jgi:uncharacterized membrane protein YkgB
MAFSGAIKDREMDKFRNVDGNTAVNVTGELDVNSRDKYLSLYNSLSVLKTLITTVATKITTPDTLGNFTIINKSCSKIYIGGPTVSISTGLPLEKNDSILLKDFSKSNDNEIYAIIESGSEYIYVISETTE